MKINELEQKVIQILHSRNLKDPSIRERALKKVLDYISKEKIYNKDGVLNLPDKDSLKSSYQRWKGKKINGAESSIINTMYEQLQ